jgi:hypothetical protein
MSDAMMKLCEEVIKLAEIVEVLERDSDPRGPEPRKAQNVAAAVRSIQMWLPETKEGRDNF